MSLDRWSDPGFEQVAAWFSTHTGVALPPARRADVEAALRMLMRRHGIAEASMLRERLEVDPGLRDAVISDLTIPESYFFRDPGQFDLLRSMVLPDLLQRLPPGERLRIWSAGCAGGEEPYSLAILIEEEGLADRSDILGSDISRRCLARARAAAYRSWSLRGAVGARLEERYFRRMGDSLALDARFRTRVSYSYLNLAADAWLASGGPVQDMHILFCRNVLLYFDPLTLRSVASRLLAALAPDGWLITGASDPPLWDLVDCEVVSTPAGPCYRRPAEDQRAVVRRVSAAPAPAVAKAFPDAAVRDRPAARTRTRTRKPPPIMPGPKAPPPVEQRVDEPDDSVAAAVRRLADAGELHDAEALARLAIAAEPTDAELHWLHAIVLLGLGRHDEAAAAVRRVIYIDRSLAVGHLTLGAILSRRGDRDGALRAYEKGYLLCMKHAPDDILPLSDGMSAASLAGAASAQMHLLMERRL